MEPYAPGAPVAAGQIPLAVPEIRGNEWRYVKDCLDTGWVSTAGGYVTRFERMVADRLGCRHGVATVTGTAALHMALLVAGVAPDDEVLVSALTFVAPVNAIRYVGAWPVFMDAEAVTWEMDPEKVAAFLDRKCVWRDGALHNRLTGRRVRAVLPAHILGHPVDLDPILARARQYELAVVEDATEALGARYRSRPVGHLGDVACLSFNANKIITTGGGGMLVTDRDDWAARAAYLTTQAKDDPVEYVHHAIGYNARLTNLQAAVGVAQMEQLDAFLAAKQEIARYYTDRLAGVAGVTAPREAPWAQSSWWLYTVLVDRTAYGRDSRALMRALGEEGIQTRPLWHPVHRLRPYRECQAYRVEIVDRLHEAALSLPCSVGISQAALERVAGAVERLSKSGA